MITENIPSRSGFSSPKAFHPWSRIYRSPSGSLANYFLSARIGRPIQLYEDGYHVQSLVCKLQRQIFILLFVSVTNFKAYDCVTVHRRRDHDLFISLVAYSYLRGQGVPLSIFWFFQTVWYRVIVIQQTQRDYLVFFTSFVDEKAIENDTQLMHLFLCPVIS